jgi:hypothetical protein
MLYPWSIPPVFPEYKARYFHVFKRKLWVLALGVSKAPVFNKETAGNQLLPSSSVRDEGYLVGVAFEQFGLFIFLPE